jgi:hypothetical protein
MSGYTRVTHRGEFFELALTTPNMNFAMNPRTGASPESDYHARARERFERIFAEGAAFIDEQMTALRDEFAERATFRPFDPALPRHREGEHGPCRVDFLVRMLSISVAFDSAPAKPLHEALQQRLSALFVLRARLATSSYEVTSEADALGDEKPGATRATLEQALAEARPDLDAAVTALREEPQTEPQILPYDGSLPIAPLAKKPGSAGPCRFNFRIEVPRGAELILTLSAAPTNAQWIDLDGRLRALQLEQLRKKHQRAEPGPRPGWFSRLFKRTT